MLIIFFIHSINKKIPKSVEDSKNEYFDKVLIDRTSNINGNIIFNWPLEKFLE